jgi:molybdate transport system substrate-binding protein
MNHAPKPFPLIRAFAVVVLMMLPCASASAQTLKVLTAGAFRQVLIALTPALEAGAGVKIELQNDTAGALTRRIEGGESFDVVILSMPALSTLSSEAKVEPASVIPIAKVGIGVAVRAGAPLPSPRTVEQFKEAILKARKIAYIDPASGGSSGVYLDRLFQRLGMADAVRAKAILVQGGLSAERVASGEADLAIQQISELLPAAGISFAGPLPKEIQNYTTYGSAVSARSEAKGPAALFVKSLASPEAVTVLRAKGMLPAQ